MRSRIRFRSWAITALAAAGVACGAFGTEADGVDADADGGDGTSGDAARPADATPEIQPDADALDSDSSPADDDADHGCRLTLPVELTFTDFYDPTGIGWTRDSGMVPAVEGLTAPPTTGVSARASCRDATPNTAFQQGIRLIYQLHVSSSTNDQLTLVTVGDAQTAIEIRIGAAMGYRVAQSTDRGLGDTIGKASDGEFVVLSLRQDMGGAVEWCGVVVDTRDAAETACTSSMLDDKGGLVLPAGLQKVLFGLPEQSNGFGTTTVALTITAIPP